MRTAALLLSVALVACARPAAVDRAPESPAYSGAFPCEGGEVARDTVLAESVSGAVAQDVRVSLLRCADDGWSYAFAAGRQRGEGALSLFSRPYALLADLDSDGHADLWVTGFPDGQGRVRISDVWLFDPERGAFAFDSSFSALPNLLLAPEAKTLEAGISNCGCGGGCHFASRYAVRGGALVEVEGYRQECLDDKSLRYQMFERSGDSLRVVFETDRPNDPTVVFPETRQLEFVDHTRHGL